jgi:fibronectin-binding autotransporter adhesin
MKNHFFAVRSLARPMPMLVLTAVSLLALIVALPPFAAAADLVWVGNDAFDNSNFDRSGNWQGNTLPSWGFTNSLKFNQNQNSNVTGLNYDFGDWRRVNDIFWDTTFPVARTLSASTAGGIDFKTRIENNSSFTQTVAMNLSGGKDGASDIQLNPVKGSLILSGTIYNDNSVDYFVYGSDTGTTTNLTLNTALGPNATQANVDFTVAPGRNTAVQVNASQVWAGTTTVNSGAFTTANGVTLASTAIVVGGGTVATTSANTLADTASLTVNTGRLSIGGSDTVASLAGSGGTIDIASGATLTAGNASSTSYAGSITGSGGFTKVGSGTFTLSAASSMTGTTTVSAGQFSLGGSNLLADTSAVTGSAGAVLALGGNETIGSLAGSLDVALGSSTLTVGGDGQSTTYSGGLSGSGGLTKVGSGTFTLSAASSYTGTTTVSAGQFSLGGSNLLADTSAVTGSAGAVLALGGNETIGSLAGSLDVALGSSTLTVGGDGQSTTYSGGLSGSGGLTKVGSGTFTLQGNNSYNGGTLVSAGRLVGTTSSLQGAITNNAAVEFAQATSGTYAGSMTGSGVLTKSGAGAILLTGSNGFSGGAALNAGTLAVGSANALGSSGVISFGGGTLQYSASNATDYSGRFSNAAGQLYSIDTNGQDVTLASTLAGNGSSVAKLGLGTLLLTANNTLTGGATISQGTLQVGNGTTTGNLSGPRAIAAGARLLISNTAYSLTAGWSTITGAGTLELDGGSAYGNWGSIALPSGFTGTLQVDNAGRFDVSGTSALGNASAVTIQSGAQMLVTGFSATFSQALSIAGFGSEPNWNYGALRSIRNGTVFTGPVTLTGNAGLFTQNDIGVSSMTLSGNIVDGGAGYGLTIRSDGINNPITLSGSNSFSGDTLVTKGVFNIGGRFALAGSTLDTSGAGSFALTAAGTNTYVLGGLKGSKAFAMGANSLEVGGNGQSTTYSGILSGSGGFTKIGGGTLTLSGSNSATGLTSVNAGGLRLNGSIAGGLNVAAIAALSGTGTVGGNATIAGTHSPGNSPGAQTFTGSLTYEAGALVNWELIANTTGSAGVNYDQILLPTGNLTFSGSTTLALSFNSVDSSVDWTNAFWNVNRSWIVYDLSGGTTTGLGNLVLGGSLLDSLSQPLSPTGRGYFTTSLAGQDVVLNFTAVPEPSTWAMALAAIACSGWMMRRRRRSM